MTHIFPKVQYTWYLTFEFSTNADSWFTPENPDGHPGVQDRYRQLLWKCPVSRYVFRLRRYSIAVYWWFTYSSEYQTIFISSAYRRSMRSLREWFLIHGVQQSINIREKDYGDDMQSFGIYRPADFVIRDDVGAGWCNRLCARLSSSIPKIRLDS